MTALTRLWLAPWCTYAAHVANLSVFASGLKATLSPSGKLSLLFLCFSCLLKDKKDKKDKKEQKSSDKK
jgi:hypothetical protein